ncbi:MAG TPA: hypothetical protein VFC65_11725 [Prolixibacteraceae bacterium]|nr:hypothetical protein [Prolixibacteraceae bacterium]
MENKINLPIPEADIDLVTSKLEEVITVLKPHLIALTPAERQELPKMSDGTLPFVQKCLSYCKSNPEFAPAFINFDGLDADMKVYQQLLPIYRLILQLENKLNDTTMQAGAESYVSSLNYYNSVKYAVRSDIPGAKAIYEDLKKRFVHAAKPAATAENK